MDDFQEKPKVAPIIPLFFTDKVHMEFKSKHEGRPIYEEREFVKLIVPGNRGSVAIQPISDDENDDAKMRWPKEYAAFKAKQERPLTGTPLTEWPPINRAQAEEFKHFHVYTVEELSCINDTQMQHMGMGVRELRKAAQLFLDAAKNGTGPLMKMVEENASMRAKMDAMQATMDEMREEILARRKTKEKANASAD